MFAGGLAEAGYRGFHTASEDLERGRSDEFELHVGTVWRAYRCNQRGGIAATECASLPRHPCGE